MKSQHDHVYWWQNNCQYTHMPQSFRWVLLAGTEVLKMELRHVWVHGETARQRSRKRKLNFVPIVSDIALAIQVTKCTSFDTEGFLHVRGHELYKTQTQTKEGSASGLPIAAHPYHLFIQTAQLMASTWKSSTSVISHFNNAFWLPIVTKRWDGWS